MVEYKKKKLILQSGGTRNYYYKVSSNGKKKQVSKNEYLEKKGGSEHDELSVNNTIKLINNLKEVYYRLNNHDNNNSKKIVFDQIIAERKKILEKNGLDALIEFIDSRFKLDNEDYKKKLKEVEMHEKISKKLADDFYAPYTQYTHKIDEEINALSQQDTIKLLEILVNYRLRYSTTYKKTEDKNVIFIILKLILKILILAEKGEITLQNSHTTMIFGMPTQIKTNTSKSLRDKLSLRDIFVNRYLPYQFKQNFSKL